MELQILNISFGFKNLTKLVVDALVGCLKKVEKKLTKKKLTKKVDKKKLTKKMLKKIKTVAGGCL